MNTSSNDRDGTAIIVGAGPAGLTAALELLRRTRIKPVVLEKSAYLGGISRTVNYRGNRIDIGGHRFFSKSERVMNWWNDVMPVEKTEECAHTLAYQNQKRNLTVNGAGPDPEADDLVMLLRPRQSRIFFIGKFFEYPLKLNAATIRQLGVVRTVKAGASYLRSSIRPIRPEKTLEDFLINRFGRELYSTFFKSYTEKVWGVPCDEISATWGAQRIKGLSLWKTVTHHLKKLAAPKSGEISNQNTETSLIEKFLYPKLGPGQLWEEVGRRVIQEGGEILTGYTACRTHTSGNRVVGVTAGAESGEYRYFPADYVFSTMPIKELIHGFEAEIPQKVRRVSDGLLYRDFITVGLLLNRLQIKDSSGGQMLKDNWIYLQEPGVRAGRMQIFNNWSPYLVSESDKVWIGLEYFCYEGDDLWTKSDQEMIDFAIDEMAKVGMFAKADVCDATVIRMEKTYPAYFGTYDQFDVVRDFVDRYENLFLIGRNGMHKYNNQDHSMLTAMTAVDNIVAGIRDKASLWAVNTELEYHETSEPEKKPSTPRALAVSK